MRIIINLIMKGTYLGEFEELILLAVASKTDAYAVNVKEEIETNADRTINISAVHSALYRLEEKGFLKSSFGGATQKRGGKEKRIFEVTKIGFEALRESKKLRELFWKNIPKLSFPKS